MATPIPYQGLTPDIPAAAGGHPDPMVPSAMFNGHGARLAPPPHPYFPQPDAHYQPPVPGHGHSAWQPPFIDNVRSVDPTITTQGVPKDPQSAADAKDPSLADETLKKLGDQELLKKGNDQLESAKEAYTTYGQIKLADDAKKAIQPFIDCANLHHNSSSELFHELKKVKLPDNAPKDLAVTIKFPGPDKETVSLIPPGEALKTVRTNEVLDWYRLAFQAMFLKAQELTSGNDNALAQAEATLNDVVATLKAIRKEIDRRKLLDNMGSDRPSGSQLEIQYHEFTEKGVTISQVAKGDLLKHPFEAQGKVPNPTEKPTAFPAGGDAPVAP